MHFYYTFHFSLYHIHVFLNLKYLGYIFKSFLTSLTANFLMFHFLAYFFYLFPLVIGFVFSDSLYACSHLYNENCRLYIYGGILLNSFNSVGYFSGRQLYYLKLLFLSLLRVSPEKPLWLICPHYWSDTYICFSMNKEISTVWLAVTCSQSCMGFGNCSALSFSGSFLTWMHRSVPSQNLRRTIL